MLYAKVSNHILPVLGKKLCKGFTIYGDGGHLGHVTLTILNKLSIPLPIALYGV